MEEKPFVPGLTGHLTIKDSIDLNSDLHAPDKLFIGNHAPDPMILTRRDIFAALAMQGFAANELWLTASPDDTKEMATALAQMGVKCADALIAELAKEAK